MDEDGLKSVRLVFMGTPEFAVPILDSLVAACRVMGVVTQPDREAGRGRRVERPPVKQTAQRLGLPVIQPRRLREPEAMAQLRDWAADLIVVAAFGQILRPEVLDLPPKGCLNVHASLLPRWRGAAPISAAILAGDAETGITIMQMDPGLDTGPVIAQRALPIQPEDSTQTLSERLSRLGAELLVDTLPGYLDGRLRPQPQDEASATYAGQLKKADGHLDFHLSAADLARRVRAFDPWPGAFAVWNGRPLKVLAAHAGPGSAGVGRVVLSDGQPAVGAGQGILVLDRVQPAGKRAMSGEEFLRGAREFIGEQLG